MNRHWGLLLFVGWAGIVHAQGGLSKSIPAAGSGDAADQAPVAELADPTHKLYLGADYADSTLKASSSGIRGFPSGKYTSSFVDIRAGFRVFDAVGVEVHGGVPYNKAHDDFGEYRTTQYYAGFIVPTAAVFSRFELAFPIGYAHTRARHVVNGQVQSNSLNSVAFGARIEVPIREFLQSLPDLRLTGGGTVDSVRRGAQDYRFQGGLRFDFGLGGSGG